MALCAAAPFSQAALAELNGRLCTASPTATRSLCGWTAATSACGSTASTRPTRPASGKSTRRSLAQICRRARRPPGCESAARDERGRTHPCERSLRRGESQARSRCAAAVAWVHLRVLCRCCSAALNEAETNAPLQKVVLWRGKEPVPPWEWRARQTKKTNPRKRRSVRCPRARHGATPRAARARATPEAGSDTARPGSAARTSASESEMRP